MGSKQGQEKPYSHCFVQLNLTWLTLVHLYLILKELYMCGINQFFLRVSTNTAKNRVHGFLLPKKKSWPYFSCLSSLIPIKWILCLLVNFLQHVISIERIIVSFPFSIQKKTCCKCVFCPEWNSKKSFHWMWINYNVLTASFSKWNKIKSVWNI